MAEKEKEIRRIIMVGKTGNGKSTTGNSLLEMDIFKSEKGLASVTQECQVFSRFREDVKREYTIVDTPGLFDTDIPFAKRALEIQKALEICPNPHAFFIVLRPDTRYTEDEKLIITMLHVIFGMQFFNHAVLVFTRGAEYMTDQELNDVISKRETVDELKQKCGSRVVRVENNVLIDITTRNVLTRKVLDSVEQVSDGGKKVYLYDWLDVHRTCLEQQLKNRKPNAELGEDLEQLLVKVDRQLEKIEKEKKEREENNIMNEVALIGNMICMLLAYIINTCMLLIVGALVKYILAILADAGIEILEYFELAMFFVLMVGYAILILELFILLLMLFILIMNLISKLFGIIYNLPRYLKVLGISAMKVVKQAPSFMYSALTACVELLQNMFNRLWNLFR